VDFDFFDGEFLLFALENAWKGDHSIIKKLVLKSGFNIMITILYILYTMNMYIGIL
jgi:hypothetical protein